ncbi:MAG: VWA domain-containing protein, partial [bacterium]|nr:VWA domain-containing protein [bacterium]
SKISVKAFGVEGSAETRQLQAEKDAATELEKFQSILDALLIETPNLKIMVLIDKADEVWNQTQESELMIIGLIRAVHDLNSELQKAHFILFLRSDIYDILKFNDADKLHSMEERLDWQYDDLKHLISTRGKVSANLEENHPDQIWQRLFDDKVNGIDSFDYIIQRTLKRPRELIQFCNSALAKAQDNKHTYITTQDVLDAEKQYSNWKLKDIASEFAIQYPYLEELLALFQGFKAGFIYSEFDTRYKETKARLVFPELEAISTDKILQILYIIGFLGAATQNQTIFVYDDPLLLLAKQSCIIVHPAYYLALGLSQPTNFPCKDSILITTDINVSGDIITGDKVVQTRYEPLLSHSRELESFFLQQEELIEEKAGMEMKLTSLQDTETPESLLIRLQEIEEQLETINEKIKTTQQNLKLHQSSRYQVLATTATPGLIIYVIDVSQSMSSLIGENTRINVVEKSLEAVITDLVFRSTKGRTISPRYKLAMLAYSNEVYDVLNGVKTVEEVAKAGLPVFTNAQGATETAKAFNKVASLLRQEIPKMHNAPAPIVCHITDGIYSGEDPLPIVKKIMDMSVNDGNVLVENIFISDVALRNPIASITQWPGITSKADLTDMYAKKLFDMSSTIPETYRENMRDRGLFLAQNAKLLFPGTHPEFIRSAIIYSAMTMAV